MRAIIRRNLVAELLNVDADTLPAGDLPVGRLAEHIVHYLADTQHLESPPPDHPLGWAMAVFLGLIEDQAELGFLTCLAVLDQCHSAQQVAMLAAGPLDDLITRHGAELLPALQDAAQGPRFRYALTGVWLEEASPLLKARITALCQGEATLDQGAPLPPPDPNPRDARQN